jgi:hypothetical protein
MTDSMLQSCRQVFEDLWLEGEESRTILWQQIIRLAAVQDAEAAKLAWSITESYASGPADDILSSLSVALSNRLIKDCEDPDNWGVDWEAGSQALISITTQRKDALDSQAQEILADLIVALSQHDECADQACQITETLASISSEHLSKVVTHWIGRLLTDLPSACAKWIAKCFATGLAKDEKTQFTNQLNNIVNKDNVPEQEAETYLLIIKHLPPDTLRADLLATHLNGLCTQIQARHANPNKYLNRIFPVIPTVIDFCPPGPMGNMLHVLFANAKNNPPLFAWLHEVMVGSWPRPDSNLGPYNAEQVFQDALTAVMSSPKTKHMDGALLSAASMLTDGVVERKLEPRLAQAACVLWPHQSEAAGEALQLLQVIPTPQDIAGLASHTDTNDADAIGRLQEIWNLLAHKTDDEQLIEVGAVLATSPMKGTDSEPDLCFRMWLDTCSGQRENILHSLLSDDGLNDEQTSRVWLQVVRVADGFDIDVILNDLLAVITDAKPESTRCVLENAGVLNSRFSSKDDQYRLATVLLHGFIRSTSQETQNRLAKWVSDLGADAVLKEVKTMGDLSDDQINRLKELFPKSKHLK